MRRNDYDVTDSIRTTDPAIVAAEVIRLYQALYDGAPAAELEPAFARTAALYRGKHPEYCPCDTEYHDLQHVLDVTLAMSRLLDGYERGRSIAEPALTRQVFVVGVVCALLHDFGYLRRRNDRKHHYGAEYTLTHVSRSSAFLRQFVREMGMEEKYSRAAAILVHYTGYERPAETIRLGDTLLRRVGHMLGSADILAQMSDRCYLEKCRDRLYPEFVLGGLAGRRRPGMRRLPVFESGRTWCTRRRPSTPAHRGASTPARARLRVRRPEFRRRQPLSRGNAEERARCADRGGRLEQGAAAPATAAHALARGAALPEGLNKLLSS